MKRIRFISINSRSVNGYRSNIYSSYNKEIMEATAAIATTIRDATERTV